MYVYEYLIIPKSNVRRVSRQMMQNLMNVNTNDVNNFHIHLVVGKIDF